MAEHTYLQKPAAEPCKNLTAGNIKAALMTAFLIMSMASANMNGATSPDTNSTKQHRMVFIQSTGHAFRMGSTGIHNAHPHTVRFTYDYWIGRHEVTQRDYHRLMDGNPSEFIDSDSLPVETVTWYDAMLYCNAISKIEGYDTVYSYAGAVKIISSGNELSNVAIHYDRNGYRLPTEAEWEYACRAGEKKDYFWGNDTATAGRYCWFHANSGQSTQKTGAKKPNDFGLCDMAGNVGEWCNDLYGQYPNAAAANPVGPGNGEYRVLRGGSWAHGIRNCRSAFRNPVHPTNRADYIGFRICRGQFLQ